VSVPVTVLPEARQDILDGRDFFERGRPGAGAAFAAEVLAVLDRIADQPELYGEVSPGVRAAGVRRFGYVVYYRVGPGGVEVIAVLHGGRDPSVWQGRA
jgi:plasmid stabilization system protein ParE